MASKKNGPVTRAIRRAKKISDTMVKQARKVKSGGKPPKAKSAPKYRKTAKNSRK